MKVHILTIGSPRLDYAKSGWQEYTKRLGHYHQLRITHLPDKQNNAKNILEALKGTDIIALVIDGPQLSSQQLAELLEDSAGHGREISFVIGGPDGLPEEVINAASKLLGLSKLTFPHDLAMVILAETLYRSSTINSGLPYHRG